MTDEHYFVYAYDASGTLDTAGFTATANADLDCDNVGDALGFGTAGEEAGK